MFSEPAAFWGETSQAAQAPSETPENIGAALRKLRLLSDQLDRIEAMKRERNARWVALERYIAEESERVGVSKFSGDGISVSVEQDIRVSYEPEKWDDLLRWAVETGNTSVVQRRVGEAAIKSMVDAGMGQPPGVKLSPYTKVSVRRK